MRLYARSDGHHAFFGAALAPGLLVDDFDKAVRELERLEVEWLTDTSSASGRQWRHYRAADGNAYEIMGTLVGSRPAQVRLNQ